MRRKFRLMVIFLLLMAFTACSGVPTSKPAATTLVEETASLQAFESTPATWANLSWMKDTSPITLSIYVDEMGDEAAQSKWGDDAVSREITRLTGVSLQAYCAPLNYIPTASYEKSLETMIATGEFTDYIYLYQEGKTDSAQFHNSSLCYPWDELIDEYCPELKDLVETVEILNNYADDGHFYTLKTGYANEKAYLDDQSIFTTDNSFELAYRADILEKMDLPLFTSLETFEKTLYAIKQAGQAYGIVTPYYRDITREDPIAYYMGCQHGNRWDQSAGSIKTQYTDPAWLEYYKLMNRWYRDGIIPGQYPVTDIGERNQYSTSKEVFAISGMATAVHTNRTWRAEGNGGKYDDLTKPVYIQYEDVLPYEGKVQAELTDYKAGQDSLFITRSCSAPDRAIRFVEFLKSPQGDMLTYLGIEGEDYIFGEDGRMQRILPEDLTKGMENLSTGLAIVSYREQRGYYKWNYQTSLWMEGLVLNGNNYTEDEYDYENEERRLNALRTLKKLSYENKNPAMVHAQLLPGDVELEYLTQIEERWAELDAELICANSESEVELIWKEFQKFLEFNGIDAIEKRMTQRFGDHLKRYHDAGYYTNIG